MKCVRGIGEGRWPVRIGLRFVEVWVKHDVCSMPCSAADGLRIPPAFVADRDTEGKRGRLKDAATRAWCVGALFGGVDLDLVLKARDRSVLIDNQGGR